MRDGLCKRVFTYVNEIRTCVLSGTGRDTIRNRRDDYGFHQYWSVIGGVLRHILLDN